LGGTPSSPHTKLCNSRARKTSDKKSLTAMASWVAAVAPRISLHFE
jgi:hypothetical protein